MKSVNAVVHVHESESESMELSSIIHGLVLKSHENHRVCYLPMKFHGNNMGIHAWWHTQIPVKFHYTL